MDHFFWLLGILAAGVVVALATAISMAVSRRRTLASVADALGGTYESGDRGSGTIGGVEFFYTYRPGQKNVPPSLVVSVAAASGLPFQVKREDFVDRAFKVAGLSEEAQTGVPEFDADFYIVCNSAQGVARLFSVADNRAAVRWCFTHGCHEVKHDGVSVSAVLYLSGPANHDLSRVRAVVPHLAVLATAVRKIAPAVVKRPAWRMHDGPGYGLGVCLFVGMIVAVAAAAGGYTSGEPVDTWDFAVRALAVSVTVAVLIAVALVRSLKGPAMSPGALFLILFTVLLGVPLLGWAGGGWLNAALDTGPATVHVVPVLGTKRYSGRYGEGYVVRVRSWRPGGPPVELSHRGRVLFTQVQDGSSLAEVTTRPGFFGFEWVADRSSLSPPATLSPSRK